MKVLYVTYPDYIYTSGIVWNQVFTLLNKMCEQEPSLEVRLVCFVPFLQWLSRPKRRTVVRNYLHPRIELWTFPAFFKRNWIVNLYSVFLASTLPFLTCFFWRRKVELIHTRGLLAGLIAGKLKRKVPLYVDIRGLFPEEGAKLGFWAHNDSSFCFWKKAESRMIKKADAVNYVSEKMANHYEAIHPHPKISIIPPCVDKDAFTPADISSPHAKSSRYLAVYSGSFGWTSMEALQKIFKTLKKVKPNSELLILLPYGIESEINKVKKEFFGHFAASEVRVEHAWPEEMPAKLKQAHLGLLVRDASEVNLVAWPTKCLEYWACGLPVLTNGSVSAVEDAIQKEKIGVILSLTSEEEDQFRLIQFFSGDKNLGERCRKFAADNFSLEKTAELYLKEYRLLIANSEK